MIELGVTINLDPGKKVFEQPSRLPKQATAFVRFVPRDLILEDGRTVEPFANGDILYCPPGELVKQYEKHKDTKTWWQDLSAAFSNGIPSRNSRPLSGVHCLQWVTQGVEIQGLNTIAKHSDPNDFGPSLNILFLHLLDCGPNKTSSGLVVTLCWAMAEDLPLDDAQRYTKHGVESLTYMVRNKLGWYFPYLIYDPFAETPPSARNAALNGVRKSMHAVRFYALQSRGFFPQMRFHNVLEFAIVKTIFLRASVHPSDWVTRLSALHLALSKMHSDPESTDCRPFDGDIVCMLLGIATGGGNTDVIETPIEIKESVRRFSQTLLWDVSEEQAQAVCKSLGGSFMKFVDGPAGCGKSLILLFTAAIRAGLHEGTLQLMPGSNYQNLSSARPQPVLIIVPTVPHVDELLALWSRNFNMTEKVAWIGRLLGTTWQVIQGDMRTAVMVVATPSAAVSSPSIAYFRPHALFIDCANCVGDIDLLAIMSTFPTLREYHLYGDRNQPGFVPKIPLSVPRPWRHEFSAQDGYSLFKRSLEAGIPAHRLSTHHRSDTFARFSEQLFYGGQHMRNTYAGHEPPHVSAAAATTVVSFPNGDACRLEGPSKRYPLLLVDSKRRHPNELENPFEASLAAWYVNEALPVDDDSVKDKMVEVICMTREQVRLVENAIKDAATGKHWSAGDNVRCVTYTEATEADITILSLVYTLSTKNAPPEHFYDDAVINLVTSRHKRELTILGNVEDILKGFGPRTDFDDLPLVRMFDLLYENNWWATVC